MQRGPAGSLISKLNYIGECLRNDSEDEDEDEGEFISRSRWSNALKKKEDRFKLDPPKMEGHRFFQGSDPGPPPRLLGIPIPGTSQLRARCKEPQQKMARACSDPLPVSSSQLGTSAVLRR